MFADRERTEEKSAGTGEAKKKERKKGQREPVTFIPLCPDRAGKELGVLLTFFFFFWAIKGRTIEGFFVPLGEEEDSSEGHFHCRPRPPQKLPKRVGGYPGGKLVVRRR